MVLTIRGRKYTPKFDFFINNHKIEVSGVQTEVDAGYEGKDKLVLIEAKNKFTKNIIIRQLYYPFRQWQYFTKKRVIVVFFTKDENTYSLWQYDFKNPNDYNSINLIKCSKYKII